MEGDDGLAGAGGAGDASRSVEVAFDKGALGGVEEDRPGFPGRVEGGLEFVAALEEAETALRVGVQKRIRGGFGGDRCGKNADGEVEEGFGGLGGEVFGEVEEGVLVGGAGVGEPVGRNAAGEEDGVFVRVEEPLGVRRDRVGRWKGGLILYPLADLDDLGGAGGRVSLDAAAFGPGIGIVVVADIREQEVRRACGRRCGCRG